MVPHNGSPKEYSVNDNISREDCSFHYMSVDLAVEQIKKIGPGSLMAKMDIERAHRNIPIVPNDCRLLGLEWQSETYVDKVLPFGLRSAPLNSLQWRMPSCG